MDAYKKFQVWMAKVNALIESTVGLGADDMADVAYHDWYENGVKPETAAKRALKANGWRG